MATLQITIHTSDPAIAGILVARLSESGFEGFEERDTMLLAYIPREKFIRGELERLLGSFSLEYSYEELQDKNWNEEWEKNFQPVSVNGFCAVRASFHEPQTGVLHEIIITPKMSFGTGHHATTYMMMEAMQGEDFTGKTVLDFGTGTGVLAILAEKLGALEILAIDYDEWSISNALENISVNLANRIAVQKMDSINSTKRFDIILANINKNVIINNLYSIAQHLTTDGVILLSGILESDVEDMVKAAAEQGLLITQKLTRQNWLCIRLVKRRDIT